MHIKRVNETEEETEREKKINLNSAKMFDTRTFVFMVHANNSQSVFRIKFEAHFAPVFNTNFVSIQLQPEIPLKNFVSPGATLFPSIRVYRKWVLIFHVNNLGQLHRTN